MPRQKGVLKSNNSNLRSTAKHKQIDMNEKNASVAVLSQATDTMSDIERQNSTDNEQAHTKSQLSSFHHSSGSKYLHKKFKRIASAEIDDNSPAAKVHINESQANSPGDTVNSVTREQTEVNFVNEKTRTRDATGERLQQQTSQLNSHNRFANGDNTMCNYSSQVPIDDISGCIATSDSQLNNCSGSTVDDILSKSTINFNGKQCPSANTQSSTSYEYISSQQSSTSNISNAQQRPYKPKFHKVYAMPMDHSEQSESISIESRIHSDSAEQLACNEPLEPLNLTISSIEANHRKLQTVESVHGISSTSNSQSATYLDEPIASPGPFLGKTRLVDDHNRRSSTNQPNQIVNRTSDVNDHGDVLRTDMTLSEKNLNTLEANTNDRSIMTEIESGSCESPKCNEIISNATVNVVNDHHLDAITSTSELSNSIKMVTSAVKLGGETADTVSMQIAEVSSSVNPLLITTDELHPLKSLSTITQKPETAKRIASEIIELTNKQINSTTNGIDERRAPSDSFVIANKKNENAKRARVISIGSDVLVSVNSKSTSSQSPFIQKDDGPLRCTMCSASFPKSSLLKMHMNIHYMNPERKFHCDACDKSFRTQNRLQKHACFETKVAKTNKNPRPFTCSDCNIAFRIHGHLAKHLRSKTHIQNLENLQKLPSGTYAMLEKAQINLSDIDTSDCDNSLESLKILAKKLNVDQNLGSKNEN